MKSVDISAVGPGVGYPPSQQGFNFLQQAYKETFAAIARGVSGEATGQYVLYGLVKTSLGGSNYSFSEGWIYDTFTGECYHSPAVASIAIASHAVMTITTTYAAFDPWAYSDGSLHNTHKDKTLVISNGALGSADFNYEDLKFVHTSTEKIIAIGTWDMDATPQVTIAHGVTASKILSAMVVIRDDTGTTFMPLDISNYAASNDFPQTEGRISWTATDIVLDKRVTGIFDNVNYNDTTISRGYITLKLIV